MGLAKRDSQAWGVAGLESFTARGNGLARGRGARPALVKTRKSINDRPKSLTYGQVGRGKGGGEALFASPSDEIAQCVSCDGNR